MSKKVALITGGSRGIGLGIALKLAEEGWSLAINGVRDASKVRSVLEDFESKHVDAIYCQGDIGNKEHRERIIKNTLNHFGHINVLVNNAGVAPLERQDLLDMSEESYDRVLNINLKGTFFLSQMVARAMIESKNSKQAFNASIINISSISAETVSINRGEYCISKAGLSMVTKLLASRLGTHNIPVYEVRPGIIETDMTSGVKEKYDKLFSQGLSIQSRWGKTEDVGKTVVALVRGDLPYSTGQVIMVDGGMSIQRL